MFTVWHEASRKGTLEFVPLLCDLHEYVATGMEVIPFCDSATVRTLAYLQYSYMLWSMMRVNQCLFNSKRSKKETESEIYIIHAGVGCMLFYVLQQQITQGWTACCFISSVNPQSKCKVLESQVK
jgi:hypothetical protein